MNDMAKVAEQPRYMEMANQVADELISEFGPKEQREFVSILSNRIEQSYLFKIEETKQDLAMLNESRDIFLGNPVEMKKSGY